MPSVNQFIVLAVATAATVATASKKEDPILGVPSWSTLSCGTSKKGKGQKGQKGKRGRNKGIKVDIAELLASDAKVAPEAQSVHYGDHTFDGRALQILSQFARNNPGHVRFNTHVDSQNTTQKPHSTKQCCKHCLRDGEEVRVPWTRCLRPRNTPGNRRQDFDKEGNRIWELTNDNHMMPGKSKKDTFPIAECPKCGSGLVFGDFAFRNSDGIFVSDPNTIIGADGSDASGVMDYLLVMGLAFICELDNSLHRSQEAADNHLKHKGHTKCTKCGGCVPRHKIGEYVRYNCSVINAEREAAKAARNLATHKRKFRNVLSAILDSNGSPAQAKVDQSHQFTTVTNKRRPQVKTPAKTQAKTTTKTKKEMTCSCGFKCWTSYQGNSFKCNWCRSNGNGKGKGKGNGNGKGKGPAKK